MIANLDSLEEVVPLLKELGGRHGANGYNVPPTYFPVSPTIYLIPLQRPIYVDDTQYAKNTEQEINLLVLCFNACLECSYYGMKK